MMVLSPDEQRYLLDAFDSWPTGWFQPRHVSREHFSDRTIDQLVQSLARQGMMDGEPDCHARLTDLGRKTAKQCSVMAKRDWRKFYQRRRSRIAIAAVAVVLSLVLVVLRTTGLL